MKKLLVAAISAAALLVAAAPASADPADSNSHNCVGYFLSVGAGQGFGDDVSDMAQDGLFDDFVRTLRDSCVDTRG
ncbi:MAG TPA: hypothetical protein VF545_06475 [Thermoleophilaceae bacterium]|jgi:opacity protein-like surface antigen